MQLPCMKNCRLYTPSPGDCPWRQPFFFILYISAFRILWRVPGRPALYVMHGPAFP